MNTTTGGAVRAVLRALYGIALLVALAGCSNLPAVHQDTYAQAQETPGTSGIPDTPTTGPSTDSAGPFAWSPGLPTDWSPQSIHAAIAALQTCAQASTLTPPNCPQIVNTYGEVLAAHWQLLNQPLEHAVAVRMQTPNQTETTGSVVQVAVFGLFQMDVSYTVAGDSQRPYLDYVGGTAAAVITWDSGTVQSVAFAQNNGAFNDLPAVTVTPFSRPAQVSDPAVLQLVKDGFQQCVTRKMPLSAVIGIHNTAGPMVPNCPQQLLSGLDVNTVTATWVLNADPTSGALVSFDTQHGNFAVTGTYDMKLNSMIANVPYAGPRTSRSTGNYTATVTLDGQHLALVKITR